MESTQVGFFAQLKGILTLRRYLAATHVVMLAFKDKPKFALNFDYRSVTGKLNNLAQTSRPDIMYAVH